MINWKNANAYDLELLNQINSIFSNNSKLLYFLFNPNEPRLAATSKVLLRESGAFSTGEQVLIQVALDIWDRSGNTKLMDLFSSLDSDKVFIILKILMKNK